MMDNVSLGVKGEGNPSIIFQPGRRERGDPLVPARAKLRRGWEGRACSSTLAPRSLSCPSGRSGVRRGRG